MRGFYDRWMMRQKGLLTATFIGPEEVEFRHPERITDMLYGLNGVSFRQSIENELVPFGYNGTCQMAIDIDDIQQCPGNGCMGGDHSQGSCRPKEQLSEHDTVAPTPP